MELSHYSACPLREVVFCPQIPDSYKPSGLWVSVDGEGDWPSWCARNGVYHYCENTVRSIVTLADDANILVVNTSAKLSALDKEYGFAFKNFGKLIDWFRFAQDYDGLIIAPLQGKKDYFWYTGWDCNSGCIWHPRAIKGISLHPFDARPKGPSVSIPVPAP